MTFSSRGAVNRTSGERDATQPRESDQLAPFDRNGTGGEKFGEADCPARSFLDDTVPADEGWIDASRPRRVEQEPVVQQGTWRKAMPAVSGLLFTAWAVEAFTEL